MDYKEQIPNEKNEDTPLLTIETKVPVKYKLWKIFTSLQYFIQFIGFGATFTCLGWSSTILQNQVKVKSELMGWIVTGIAIGQAIFSFLSGFTIDFLNKLPNKWYIPTPHHWIALAVLTNTIVLLVVPEIKVYWLLLLIHVIMGAANGIIDASSNSLLPWIWTNKVNPWMCLMHFGFGIGSSMSGFIASQFVREDDDGKSPDSLLRMKYSYWIHSGIVLCTMIGLLFLKSPKMEKQSEEMETSKTPTKKLSKEFLLTIFISIFLFLYAGAENSFFLKIVESLEKRMDMKTSRYIMTTFTITFSLGRIVGAVISLFVRSSILLAVSILGVLSSSILMMIFSNYKIVLWICCGVIGLSMSNIYPTVVALPNSEMEITIPSKLTSLMMVGANLGNMTIPLLVSYLFTFYGPNALSLVETIIFGILLLILVIVLIFSKISNHRNTLEIN